MNVFIVVCYCRDLYLTNIFGASIFHINTVKVSLLIVFYLNFISHCVLSYFNSFLFLEISLLSTFFIALFNFYLM